MICQPCQDGTHDRCDGPSCPCLHRGYVVRGERPTTPVESTQPVHRGWSLAATTLGESWSVVCEPASVRTTHPETVDIVEGWEMRAQSPVLGLEFRAVIVGDAQAARDATNAAGGMIAAAVQDHTERTVALREELIRYAHAHGWGT